jgi:hypothetical protein
MFLNDERVFYRWRYEPREDKQKSLWKPKILLKGNIKIDPKDVW